jgi:hypothetical protein
MTSDVKRKTLLCLVGVVILIVLIAAALPHLELKPGLPLPAMDNRFAGQAAGNEMPAVSVPISTVWKAILAICALAVLIYNIYRLLRNTAWNWRNILSSLLYICVPIFIIVVILVVLSGARFTSEPDAMELPPPVVEQPGPPLGPVPMSLIWIAGLSLAAALVGLGLWFIFHSEHAGTDRLALQAELALQALRRGDNLKNVIVRCYWQMGRVLKEEQGIEMDIDMTVREFEGMLEDRGVPRLPVHQLTRLFEMARYGHRATSTEDERQAIQALTAIVQYSRATRQQDPV